MTKLHVTLAVVALMGASYFAGRLAAPAPVVVAQEKEGMHGGAPHTLPRPHDVIVHAEIEARSPQTGTLPEGATPKVVNVSGAVTFDIDKAGEQSFLRLTNNANKIWYFKLNDVAYVEATPIGGGATPAAAPK